MANEVLHAGNHAACSDPEWNMTSRGKREVAAVSHSCHCEERSDEAISTRRMRDCFASLAMTYRAMPSKDFAIALRSVYRLLVVGWSWE